ncbi:MAG TPA: hypothetical protein VMF69_06585 [Gemmataceae bacterium]|nr:hypothetical protein [Gemmataceae bacterium]
MRLRTLAGAAVLLTLTILPALAARGDEYQIKTVDKTPAPKEVQEPIRKLLAERCVQLLTAKGDLLAEVWFRKDMPVKATDAQIKNGLTYAEVLESTVFGAIRFPKQITDYRKQKIPAGVYTLRLANQPMDGDHMGTAPYSEFLLLSPAADDKMPDTMEAKKLQEMSGKTTGSHPGVLLLFPGKGAAETPKLEKKEENHWVLLFLLDAKAGDKNAVLPVGLTLIGVSSSA